MSLWDKAKGLVSRGIDLVVTIHTAQVEPFVATSRLVASLKTGDYQGAVDSLSALAAAYRTAYDKVSAKAKDLYLYAKGGIPDREVPWPVVIPVSIDGPEQASIAASMAADASGLSDKALVPKIARYVDHAAVGPVQKAMLLKTAFYALSLEGKTAQSPEQTRDAIEWLSMVAKQRAKEPESNLWAWAWVSAVAFSPGVESMMQKTLSSQERVIKREEEKASSQSAYHKPERKSGSAGAVVGIGLLFFVGIVALRR